MKNHVRQIAASRGLDAGSIEQFFLAQISAAKAIQYRYRAELLSSIAVSQVVDLQTEIRPVLDQPGAEIMALFVDILTAGTLLEQTSREEFFRLIQHRFLTNADKESLFQAMLNVRLNCASAHRILNISAETGTLRLLFRSTAKSSAGRTSANWIIIRRVIDQGS